MIQNNCNIKLWRRRSQKKRKQVEQQNRIKWKRGRIKLDAVSNVSRYQSDLLCLIFLEFGCSILTKSAVHFEISNLIIDVNARI